MKFNVVLAIVRCIRWLMWSPVFVILSPALLIGAILSGDAEKWLKDKIKDKKIIEDVLEKSCRQ